MENDKLSKTGSSLASTVPDGITFNEAEYRKNCIQNRIRQLQTEIWVLESQMKSTEGNGLLRDDSDTVENVRVEEGKWESFKIQENILKSQVGNFITNVNLLEDELRSSILKINCIKDNIKRCFVAEENSEFTSASFIAPNCSNLAVPDLDNEHDRQSRNDNSVFEGSSQSADPEKENGNKLSQDVMELIFKQNLIITTRDLLNFRCVNRTWRDAATSILLIKDSCQLNLELKSIPTADKQNSENKVYCRRHRFNVFPLTDLLPIIRASRKFPTTSLIFSGHISEPSVGISNFHNQKELLQFFTLYGKFIKSINIGISISRIELEDLLSQYTPNLECLKFKSLDCISDELRGNLFSQPTPGVCSSLKVISTGRSIYFHPDETVVEQCYANVKALLDVAAHLESIKKVRLELSRILVEEQKVHLIKELIFEPYSRDPQIIEMTNNLVAMNPKLSVLKVGFHFVAGDSRTIVTSALNTLLESSKDTLEYFKIEINLYDFPRKIRIPRLKNLKHIKFSESMSEDEDENQQDPIFEFPEAKAGHELFPNLYKVEVRSQQNFSADGALMRFFPYHLNNRGDGSVTDNCVPSVKVLQIVFSEWLSLDNELPNFPRLFPNIRHLTLTIYCNFEKTFQNSFWDICPLAESVEIIIGWDWSERHYHQPAVDSFFTGFPSELCSRLQKMDLPLKYRKDKELIKVLRVKSSICDLQYLKFLTVRFFKSTSSFISKVTGLYAFQQMPQMKVTFTCDRRAGIEGRKKVQRLCSHLTDFVNVDIDTTSVGNGTLDHESVTEEHLDGDTFTDSYTDICSSCFYNSDGSFAY